MSKEAEIYSEEETVARREAALSRMLTTPPKPHKPTTSRKMAKHKPVEKPE